MALGFWLWAFGLVKSPKPKVQSPQLSLINRRSFKK